MSKNRSVLRSVKRWSYILVIPLVLTIQVRHILFSYTFLRREERHFYFPFEPESELDTKSTVPATVLPSKNRFQGQEEIRDLTNDLLAKYMQFHRHNRFKPNARKLIHTGNGNWAGMGDRFRGLFSSFYLAILTRRVLLIDWRDPFPINLLFESAKGVSVMYDPRFDLGPLPVTPRWEQDKDHDFILLSTTEKPVPICNCSFQKPGILLSSERTVFVRDENWPEMRQFMNTLSKHRSLSTARQLSSIFQSRTNWIGFQSHYMFRALLRASPELISRLASMRRDLLDIVPPRLRAQHQGSRDGFISVHARIGHGVGEGWRPRFDVAVEGVKIEQAAVCLAMEAAKQADNAKLPRPQTFYLATDTPEMIRLFGKEIVRRSRGARVKVMGANVVHSSLMTEPSQTNKNAFLNTGVELFFLSAGDRLVSLPSGFANLAACLGDMPHVVISREECKRVAESLI